MLISANKNQIDGMSKLMFSTLDIGIPVVEVTIANNYEFNPNLLSLNKKPYVLIDYCEYGSKDWDRTKTHIFGRNTFTDFDYKFGNNPEWQKLDTFISENPPVVTFKRELLEKDAADNIIPIEYPCLVGPVPAQTKEEYDARRIELLHYWGWSHESRRVFHGNAWIYCAAHGIALCDNLDYLQNLLNGPDSKRVWITTNIPDYARYPLQQILMINGNSKLSLSLPGCGVKCVRHSEIPVNGIMVMQEDNLAWSFPFIHGVNSIKVPIGLEPLSLYGLNGCPEIPVIEAALQRDDLYEIYLQGMINLDNYRLNNYINNYIKPSIEARL